MKCEQIQNRLIDYLDGDLLPADRILVELHLDGCGDCREKLSEQRAVDTLCRENIASPCVRNGWVDLAARLPEQDAGYSGDIANTRDWLEQFRRLAVAAIYLFVFGLIGGFIGNRAYEFARTFPSITDPVGQPADFRQPVLRWRAQIEDPFGDRHAAVVREPTDKPERNGDNPDSEAYLMQKGPSRWA